MERKLKKKKTTIKWDVIREENWQNEKKKKVKIAKNNKNDNN